VADDVYPTQRPRKRRGRGLLITVLVLLIIIVAGLVVLDRVGASYAERLIGDRVAQQVADQGARSDKPDVTIEGVPFLTQVADGTYQEIKIELTNLSGDAGQGKTIKMPLLDIRAKDVQAPISTIRNGGTIVATTVTGTGTIDYATVQGLVEQEGVKLGEKDGKLTVTAPVQILNQTVTVNGTATLTVKNNIVSVHFESVTAPDLPQIAIVQGLLTNYAKKLAVNVPIPALPLKLAVQKVEPTAGGLAITAGASNVPLNAGGL
jgi:hypothetical protein